MRCFKLSLWCLILIACASDKTNENDDPFSKFKEAIACENSGEVIKYAAEIVEQQYGFENLSNEIHTNLVDSLSVEFLSEIAERDNKILTGIFKPLEIWKRSQTTDDLSRLISLRQMITSLLTDPFNYESRTARYAILTAKQMMVFDSVQSDLILTSVIDNLDRESSLVTPTGNFYLAYKRTWGRYMLATACYLKSNLTSDLSAKGDLLKKAAYYSPDVFDMRYKGFMEVDHRLIGEPKSYHDYYAAYLGDSERSSDLLEHLVDLTKSIPTEENLAKLKSEFIGLKPGVSFNEFWRLSLNSSLKMAPENQIPYVYGKDGMAFSSKETKGKWVLIDFWGTWCAPCRAELPQLQEFYENNKSDSLLIITVACKDTESKVKTFMSENDYTFPVALGNEKFVKDFEVTEFPSKVLITPENKFILMPNGGIHWTSYVRSYSLLVLN